MERDCRCWVCRNLISSSVPQTDRSAELTNYPTDLLNSPPQDLSAAIQFRYPEKVTAGPSTPLRSGRHGSAVAGGMQRCAARNDVVIPTEA